MDWLMWHLKTFNDVKNPFTTIEPALIGYYSKLLFTSGEWITDDLNRVCTIQRRIVGLEGKRQKDSISIFVLVWLVHIFLSKTKDWLQLPGACIYENFSC